MPTTQLDHLVIAAASLAQGAAWAKDTLGIEVPYGGEHPQMGTHNLVMTLSNGVYFEIIAINPAQPAPNRPRWFSLDDPYVQAQLQHKPRLLTWVVNTPSAKALVKNACFPQGVVTPMRRGDLRWLFTIPADGQLPAAGLLPTIIEWQTTPHPAALLADLGCRLLQIELFHPYPTWLAMQLNAIDAASLVTITPVAANTLPYFVATLQTPSKVVELSSRLDV